MTYSQGDIVKIGGLEKIHFVITSKNSFIKALGVFHVCPLFSEFADGPLHITVIGKKGTKGTVICEQIKMIDPDVRTVNKTDSVNYSDL